MNNEEIIKEVQRRIPVNEVDDLGYLVKKSVEVSIREAVKLKDEQFKDKIDERIAELGKEIKENGGRKTFEKYDEQIIAIVRELEKLKEAIA